MKPVKAYQVTDNYEGHACVVFETNSASARRIGANELGIEWEEVETCKRVPEFDQYAPGPVSQLVLINHGWWFECTHCGRRVHDDMYCEIEDDGLNPELFDPVEKNGLIYCCEACFAVDRLQKTNRDHAIDALCEWVYTMYPEATVLAVYVAGYELERRTRNVIHCYVSFRFPGGQFPAEWAFGDDCVSVYKDDLEAWNAFRPRRQS